MGVVQLHREFLRQIIHTISMLTVETNHVLHGTGGEKILLLETQALTLERLVIGV